MAQYSSPSNPKPFPNTQLLTVEERTELLTKFSVPTHSAHIITILASFLRKQERRVRRICRFNELNRARETQKKHAQQIADLKHQHALQTSCLSFHPKYIQPSTSSGVGRMH